MTAAWKYLFITKMLRKPFARAAALANPYFYKLKIKMAFDSLKSTILSVLPIAIPVAIQTLIVASRQMIDIGMLVQVGSAEVAAVGLGSRILAISSITSLGLATAVGIIAARVYGEKNLKQITVLTRQTLVLSILLGVVLFICLYCSAFLTYLLSSDQQLVTLAAEYLFFSSFSCMAISVVLSTSAILRSMHITKPILIISVIGLVMNVFLNDILIFGNNLIPAMGVKGAAIASVVSGYVELFVLYLYISSRHKWITDIETPLPFKILMNGIKPIVRLAYPIILNSFIFSCGAFFYHLMVGKSSTDDLAVYTLITSMEMMASFLIMGFAMGFSVFIGNSIGEDNLNKIISLTEHAFKLSIVLGIVMASFAGLFIYLISPLLTGFSTQQIITLQSISIFVFVFLILKSVTITLICGVLRPFGDVRYCLMQDLICLYVVGIPLCYLFVFHLNMGLLGGMLSMLIEESLKTIFSKFRVRCFLFRDNKINA